MAKTWNFGMPKRGAASVNYRDVRVTRAGRTWTASWHVENGRLVIASAWGSRSATLRPAARFEAQAAIAEKLLGEMIDERLKVNP